MRTPTRIEKSREPDGTEVYLWDRGYVQLKKLGPGVLFFRKAGYLVNSLYDAVIETFTQELANSGSLVIICDCRDFENYEPGYRQRWGNWFMSNRGRVKAPILVQSTLVKMGVQIINMLVHVFEPFASEEAFLAGVKEVWPPFDRAAVPARRQPAQGRTGTTGV
jgi:hypothetical protein